MHVTHLRARANGGTLANDNVSAWCALCNWKNGAADVEDTRVQPREWQIEALQVIVDKILMEGAATLGGARRPQDRSLPAWSIGLIVFVPRRTLVDQWTISLTENRHLSLATNTPP